MSDRYNALVVLLEKDLKDEDAAPLIEAIKVFRGVLDVRPNVSNIESLVAEERARADLANKLWELIRRKE